MQKHEQLNKFTCKAQKTADPPQDCDWPFCGCDPYAEKVLAAVSESCSPETFLTERLNYWKTKDLKQGWRNVCDCCDKCKMIDPQNPLQAALGCRDPFQINCDCHLPARKAVKDYMIAELASIMDKISNRPYDIPDFLRKNND